jgi:hypothetical protein
MKTVVVVTPKVTEVVAGGTITEVGTIRKKLPFDKATLAPQGGAA